MNLNTSDNTNEGSNAPEQMPDAAQEAIEAL